MAEKHLKICSACLTIRDMKTKTVLRSHLTPITIAKNIAQGGLAREDIEKGNIPPLLIDMQTFTVTVEISMVFPQEARNQSTSISNYNTFEYIPKECFIISHRYLSNHVHCCTISTSHKLECQIYLSRYIKIQIWYQYNTAFENRFENILVFKIIQK